MLPMLLLIPAGKFPTAAYGSFQILKLICTRIWAKNAWSACEFMEQRELMDRITI